MPRISYCLSCIIGVILVLSRYGSVAGGILDALPMDRDLRYRLSGLRDGI